MARTNRLKCSAISVFKGRTELLLSIITGIICLTGSQQYNNKHYTCYIYVLILLVE